MGLMRAMLQTRAAQRLDRAGLQALQQKRLRALVEHARGASPYFGALYADVGADFTLAGLPPTDKRTLMENFDLWLTDRAVTLGRISRFTADLDNIGRMLDGKYLVFKTSGSTGTPAVVLYDKPAIAAASAVAALRTFARKSDFKAFMKNGKRTAGVFADYGFYLACGMSRYLSLQMPRRRSKITVDVNAPEAEIIARLNEFKPSMLSGYPQNLALLAGFEELQINPDVVLVAGELLTDVVRRRLTDKFGCYVQTHYSCTEAGEIACECSEKHLHINEDWVILEPVDKAGRPVPFGERSDKILVTNLANRVQPFIRYEVTDRVTVHDEGCACGRNTLWLEIEGRTDDALEFGGVTVAPMSLYKVLGEIKEASRFQLVQTSPLSLELRLEACDRKTAFEKARAALLGFLGQKGVCGVTLTLSDKPPCADSVSGKFKHIYKDFAK